MSEALAKTTGRSRPKTALLLGLGLVLFVILLGLGTWQVQRLHWKEGLLATIDQRTHSAPRPLADVVSEARRLARRFFGPRAGLRGDAREGLRRMKKARPCGRASSDPSRTDQNL